MLLQIYQKAIVLIIKTLIQIHIQKKQEKKIPEVELYNGIVISKKEDRIVGYKYGTYIKDGVLYSKKGEKIRNKEAYFAKAERRYISKHGKDENYLERKKQHKKDVDDFLEWKRKNKDR